MKAGNRRGRRPFRPQAERMEPRLVLNAATSVAAEVRMILSRTPGATPVRPNTPVLPLEAPATTATFIDPSTLISRPGRISVGTRDFVAPFVSLNAANGSIKIGTSSSIGDNATLVANPTKARGITGIFIGDNVSVGTGVSITGPAAVGFTTGAATTIGANAVIDGAVIRAGAFVGALARVGPGVTIPAGYRVLPGANVTTQAQAVNPALGQVVVATAADATAATATITRNVALAAAYTNLYQGNSATGPGAAVSGGPVPAALAGSTTIFFGALNNVLGIATEPTARFAPFEPATGFPTFRNTNGTVVSPPQNLAYRFPARVIGQVQFNQPYNGSVNSLGRRDSIRGDEGQAIIFGGPIGHIGNGVTIRSPLGGVRSTTTTTVVTTTTAAGVTTTTTNATTTTSQAASTATAGTTTAITTGRTAAGLATTGTVTTTIANTNFVVGGVTIGSGFRASDNATILGGPTLVSTFGTNVTVRAGAVVETSNLGEGVTVGNRAYVANSTIAAGTVIPDATIIINNVVVGQVQR